MGFRPPMVGLPHDLWVKSALRAGGPKWGGGPRGQGPLAIDWQHLFHQQSLFPVSAKCCLFSPVNSFSSVC